MTKVVPVSALVVLLACGSAVDGSSNPGGDASGPPCTLTVSGATSGSYACTTRFTVWSGTTDIGTVVLGYGTTGQTTPVIGATFTFAGVPHPGTFTDSDVDAGVIARITVTADAGSWRVADGSSPRTAGRYTLVITSVASTKVVADREIYASSGTLDATLPPVPQTSAGENVILHATF